MPPTWGFVSPEWCLPKPGYLIIAHTYLVSISDSYIKQPFFKMLSYLHHRTWAESWWLWTTKCYIVWASGKTQLNNIKLILVRAFPPGEVCCVQSLSKAKQRLGSNIWIIWFNSLWQSMPSTEMVMHCEVRYTDKQKMTIYTVINGGAPMTITKQWSTTHQIQYQTIRNTKQQPSYGSVASNSTASRQPVLPQVMGLSPTAGG
jgi:hypothetical protein